MPINKSGYVPEHSAWWAGNAGRTLINIEHKFEHNYIVGDLINEI